MTEEQQLPFDFLYAPNPEHVREKHAGRIDVQNGTVYTAAPYSPKALFWVKVIRASDPLPLPSTITTSANSLPWEYAPPNTAISLSEGDAIIRGDQRYGGAPTWDYKIGICERGKLAWYIPRNKIKILFRGTPEHAGTGVLASLIRFLHAKRRGLL